MSRARVRARVRVRVSVRVRARTRVKFKGRVRVRVRARTSPQAVEPRRPYSSPLQEHSTMLRRGRHPVRRRAPRPRATSDRARVRLVPIYRES